MSGFASTNDMTEEQVSFDELGPGLYAYTAERDIEMWKALEGKEHDGEIRREHVLF